MVAHVVWLCVDGLPEARGRLLQVAQLGRHVGQAGPLLGILRREVCGDESELQRPVLVPDLLVQVGQSLERLRRRRILLTEVMNQ